MLFSELYSSYYNAVAEILKYALREELTENKLGEIVSEKAFGESRLTIPRALKSGRWQLLTDAYRTPLKREPSLPMTTLEKRWLKAISLDKRIRLFDMELGGLEGIEPLFTPEMLCYYDQYADGDDFEEEGYILRFKTILRAIREGQPLKLKTKDRRGRSIVVYATPRTLEYSEKDDKFRLITSGCRYRPIIKLSDIVACEPYPGGKEKAAFQPSIRKASVTFTLLDERNTLERAMLHFAHLEKTVEKTDGTHYTVTLIYEPSDETELLIRLLSFGPFIRVTEPQAFVNLIKDRLIKQKKCGIL